MKLCMILFAFLAFSSAFADVTLVEKSDTISSASYFSKGRIAVYENNQLVNITDLKNQTLYGFSASGKIYFKATFKEMLAMYDKGSSELSSNLKSTNDKNAVVIKKTGKGEYAGFQCDRYELSLSSTHSVSQICVSPELRQLILKELDAGGIKNWMKIIDVDGSTDLMRQKMDEINDKVGYIIYEKTAEDIPGVPAGMSSGDVYVSVLESVSTKPVDGRKFSIPAGYKKVSVQEALGTDE